MAKHAAYGGKIPRAVDLMDTGGASLHPDLDLADAIQELSRRQTSAAPVIDTAGCLLGLLTEKDCLRILSNTAFDEPSAGTVAGGPWCRTARAG